MSTLRAKFAVNNFEAVPGVFAVRLQEDTSRRFLQIQNKGEHNIYVNFGDDTATEANSLVVQPGGFYEPWTCPTNEIKISAEAGSAGNSEVILFTDSLTSFVKSN